MVVPVVRTVHSEPNPAIGEDIRGCHASTAKLLASLGTVPQAHSLSFEKGSRNRQHAFREDKR